LVTKNWDLKKWQRWRFVSSTSNRGNRKINGGRTFLWRESAKDQSAFHSELDRLFFMFLALLFKYRIEKQAEIL
jgi:hypothetical protein